MQTKTWHIDIHLTEDGRQTRAEAVLRTDTGTELRRTHVARRSPRDPDVPAIGDELAACRALNELTHALLEASVRDVEDNVRGSATLTL